jgi:arylformamidase
MLGSNRQLIDETGLEIYDISRTICEGIPVWPGDPEFECSRTMLRRDGAQCNVSAFRMGTHTGTHIDAPFHLDDTGIDVAGIPFRNLIGPARVYSISAGECIRAADLELLNWDGVKRVLFKTSKTGLSGDGFDRRYIFLDTGASEFLVKRGILLVGTDAPSVDPFESEDLPSHKILLHHGAVILEEALLSAVLPGEYELVCLPLKFAGLDGSPVRAILLRK